MAEYILNGDFDSDVSIWLKPSGRTKHWWDATGAAHDGGSAKAGHSEAVATTELFGIRYPFTVTGSAGITSAVLNTWAQYNDGSGTTTGKGCTIKIRAQLEDPDGNFTGVALDTKTYDDSLHSYQFLNDEDVAATLIAGGDGVWYLALTMDIYWGGAYSGSFLVGWFDDVSLDINTAFSNTSTGSLSISGSLTTLATISNSSTGTLSLTGTSTTGMASDYDATGTLSISGSLTEAYAMVHTGTGTLATSGLSVSLLGAVSTHTGTLTMTGVSEGSQSIRTDWVMFLGSGGGKVYTYDKDYLSDDGVAIGSIWQSKQTDLSDQYPEMADTWKNLWKVRLIYVDKTTDTNVTVYVSTDGGVTWGYQMKTLGDGDGTTKSADFYFMKTFEFLDVKVEHSSTANEFQWAGVYLYWTPAGEHFSL